MTEVKKDLRYIRTRKSIMDAFMMISEKKDFKDITVKDITTEAMINRATFYYHFVDKYDLLEKVLSEVFLINLNDELIKDYELKEEVIVNIFLAITSFHCSLSSRCHNGYEDTIARIIKEQLEIIFYKMLQRQSEREEKNRVASVMLSWGIYGAAIDWNKNSELPPEEYIKLVIPNLSRGFYM
ncbi:TetR/AcrR family transcriptional regulator (plasmid) [Niallia circulans]|uniref:TetR/AcrR family transcriptional regulator n=1 Tax=Niallia circulans TaxID=1397 RepID=A0A553SQD6_NIACI|nr:TetR/AcrR family transcriptional regulator [Niallia circulans]TRZ39211.1 TetR/AcrR family transcriptional regulator [Niallia circulans]